MKNILKEENTISEEDKKNYISMVEELFSMNNLEFSLSNYSFRVANQKRMSSIAHTLKTIKIDIKPEMYEFLRNSPVIRIKLSDECFFSGEISTSTRIKRKNKESLMIPVIIYKREILTSPGNKVVCYAEEVIEIFRLIKKSSLDEMKKFIIRKRNLDRSKACSIIYKKIEKKVENMKNSKKYLEMELKHKKADEEYCRTLDELDAMRREFSVSACSEIKEELESCDFVFSPEEVQEVFCGKMKIDKQAVKDSIDKIFIENNEKMKL